MKQDRPLLIVTSCTRNYGWVTRAFLEGNTRWADYIVIVDQMSTDGTRAMCAEYKNVVLVDDPDMSYKENTRAKMAFLRGRELAAGRDAICFALDIDEVMPANWQNTEDGKKILASKPGDMFQLEWANIMPNGKECNRSGWQYKVFHDNGMEWQEVRMQIHTPLLPYTDWGLSPTEVHDFPLLHFGDFYPRWTRYKWIYYQFVEIQQHHSNVVAIYRMYQKEEKDDIALCSIDNNWLYKDIDIVGLVDTKTTPIFVEYIKEIVAKEGVSKFQSIAVWTDEFCAELGVKDPRSFGWKCLHAYLRMTQPVRKFILVKALDKVLKSVVR